jgi:hypothetical protein
MKQHTKWFATALVVASGLAVVSSVQAQPWQTLPPTGSYTTTVLSDFANFNLTAQYASWAPFPAGNATIISGALPGSFEVAANGYGSGAKDLAGGPLNASGAMYAQLTFTVHDSGFGPSDPTLGNINPQFDINSAAGLIAYSGGGPGYAAGQTYTFTVPLNAAAAAAIGETAPGNVDTSTIYGFNLENAGYSGTGNYDVTYDSLVLLTPVPEPTTLALLGLGAVAGLVIVRRRVVLS